MTNRARVFSLGVYTKEVELEAYCSEFAFAEAGEKPPTIVLAPRELGSGLANTVYTLDREAARALLGQLHAAIESFEARGGR